jgi:hypothetical protein
MESASADLSNFVNGSVWEVTGAPAFRSLYIEQDVYFS